jgi:hypothetical protein
MASTHPWLKWRIFGVTLPLTLLFGGMKWGVHSIGWEVWSFDALASALFGAATLVIAFNLSGTLSDYRDSEGLPAEICSAIEAIQDGNLLTAVSTPEYDPRPLLRSLLQLLRQIRQWLESGKEEETLLAAIADLSQPLASLAKFSNAPLISRVQSEQAKLRLVVLRIQLIRNTTFVAPAYALLELFTIGAAVALIFINNENFVENLTISALLFTAFVYLLLLIRDLDNPFDYSSKSSADVTLITLDQTIDRLQQQLALESRVGIAFP